MAGGVERMATMLMNEMVERGFRVGLITWDNTNVKPHYPLCAEVEWFKLDIGQPTVEASWKNRLKRQVRIRQFAKKFKPHVTIGFQVGSFLAARTALIGLPTALVSAERNSPDLFDFLTKGKVKKKWANFALNMADCITVQLDSYHEKYPAKLRKKITTINNPVKTDFLPAFPNEQTEPKCRILNIGRLSYQKNQEFLIEAFAKISPANPNWVLTLVGEGENRSKIEQLVQQRGLADCVEMVGAVTDVTYWYRNSAFFAFPSLWEGFPNALVEALAQGLPAVGLKQTSGVNELLIHKKSGLLASNNVDEFSTALQKMIDDIDFRRSAGHEAVKSVQKFSPQQIFDQWDKLFTQLARK